MIGLLVAAALSAAHPTVANAEPTDAVAAAIKQQQRQAMPSPYFLDSSTVLQVSCPTKLKDDDGTEQDGFYLGTAFYIGDGKWITARHVVRDEEAEGMPLFPVCNMAGLPIKVLEVGKGHADYAIISSPLVPPNRLVLSCAGFQQGRRYYATGYAEGNPWQVTVRLTGTGSKSYWPGAGNNEELLRGNTVQGQSGGPVSDDDGVVLGIVSAGDENGVPTSIVLSLADTSLCKVARK
jgi:S1-C subfamily serine protease